MRVASSGKHLSAICLLELICMAKHEHDFRDGFDVCVGNYGYYNEGELHDTWMRLPMDPDKIEPWLRSHGLFDEEHEEIYIYLGLRCAAVRVPGGVR